VLAPLRDQPIRILEIGSWEGRSAVFFLTFLPSLADRLRRHLRGNAEEQAYKLFSTAGVEARFDRNLASFAGRVEKIKSQSSRRCSGWSSRDAGSIWPISTAATCATTSPPTRGGLAAPGPGGIVIWDDYTFGLDLPPEEQPQPAIDAFLAEHEGSLRLLAKTKQVIVERLALSAGSGRARMTAAAPVRAGCAAARLVSKHCAPAADLESIFIDRMQAAARPAAA